MIEEQKENEPENIGKNLEGNSFGFFIFFIFIIVTFFIIIMLFGNVSFKVIQNDRQVDADNFAATINFEFEQMQKVPGGYLQTILLNENYAQIFNVTFDENYMILTDTTRDGKGKTYLYIRPENFNLAPCYEDRTGDGKPDECIRAEKLVVSNN